MNAYFNAVFTFTLSQFVHSEEITYCTIYNGRDDSRLTASVGMLVKTIPVCGVIDGEKSVLDFVKSIQNQILDTMSHTTMSFAELSRKYGVKSDIFFNYQGDNFLFDTFGGHKSTMIPVPLGVAKAPLTFDLSLYPRDFRINAEWRTDMYGEELVKAFCATFCEVAKQFLTCDKLKNVPLLCTEERRHFDLMNATDKPFDHVPAQSLIERFAQTQPDRVAAKSAHGQLTFAELDEKSNRLANTLLKMGAKDNEIVAVILERSEYVPVAEIGVTKAGCAFLPMLPSYPQDRKDYCMKDAGCRFVITDENIRELIDQGEPNKPDVPFDEHQIAYCIYTSGSTGTPKGVMVEQHNLSNFLQTAGMQNVNRTGTTMLCMSSISFDMSLSEQWGSLSLGHTIYIASEDEIHNLDKMLEAFITHKVDMMIVTPSFAWSLLSIADFEVALKQMKAIGLGAEAFQPTLFARLKSLNSNMLIVNGYGPTECTMACSAKTLTDGRNITIGGPFANMKYYVMSEFGQLLPRYAVGELIICGEGVGRGYVNLPEKTAQSFFEIDGVRAYHSGDLVRINKDLEAEFGGRKDNQVKLRGFRVELDEVENVMVSFDGVTRAKVIVRNNGTEDFLAGFFTADETIDIEELTAFMKTKLTSYMVPAAMMQIDKMPMTPGGKLDKKALPEIRLEKKNRGERRKPKKSLEEKILDEFKDVLGGVECYVDDNFFEIGGTSLSASKVVMRLKSAGHKIEYQDIFDHQTAEELAEYLESLVEKPKNEAEKREDDHSEVNEVLKFNTLKHADEVVRQPLGNVLLTGATGFLGIHILKDLLDNEDGHIYCLMRKGHFEDVYKRLKTTLFYYFEMPFDARCEERVTVIEGDITEENLMEKLKDVPFDTLINCAACVKHFANDDSIEFINVHGVENLIGVCKAKDAKMIQISTTSIPGAHTEKTYHEHLKMTEDKLFVIDDMNNQYGQSKYKAELLMLDAIKSGMRGKIVRVGNLMGRHADGEFQINMRTNAFLNALRGFVAIGKCPVSHATDPMGFSPIDCTARAVVLLAGTNDIFTAFHADSRWIFDEMKLIDIVNKCGLTIKPVPDAEYYGDFYRLMGDPEMNGKISALLTNDRPDIHLVETDNRFTANILYRLGFAWPFVDDGYLEKVIRALDTMGFFA